MSFSAPVLDCGTTFRPDYGGRDLPSTPSDNLWKLLCLATEALSNSFVMHRRYINKFIYLSRSVQPLCRTHRRAQLKRRHADHGTCDVCNNGPHLCDACDASWYTRLNLRLREGCIRTTVGTSPVVRHTHTQYNISCRFKKNLNLVTSSMCDRYDRLIESWFYVPLDTK